MIKNVLLTYDVSKRHSEVKDDMKEKGYFENITKNNKSFSLPNTTLWKKGEELKTETVLKNLEDVIYILNIGVLPNSKIKLEKAMAVEFLDWNAVENKS